MGDGGADEDVLGYPPLSGLGWLAFTYGGRGYKSGVFSVNYIIGKCCVILGART